MNKIADWIVSIIQTVPNSNAVWPYVRQVQNLSQLVKDFKTGKQYEKVDITRGWMVRIESYKPQFTLYEIPEFLHDVKIEGLSALHSRGESAREFEEHAKAVTMALNAKVLDIKVLDARQSIEIFKLARLVSLSERIWPAGGRIHHHALIQLVIKTSIRQIQPGEFAYPFYKTIKQ